MTTPKADEAPSTSKDTTVKPQNKTEEKKAKDANEEAVKNQEAMDKAAGLDEPGAPKPGPSEMSGDPLTTDGRTQEQATAQAEEATAVLEGKKGVEWALTHHPTQPVRVECENEGQIDQVRELAASYGRGIKVGQPNGPELDEDTGYPEDAWPAIVEIFPADTTNGVQYVRMGK